MLPNSLRLFHEKGLRGISTDDLILETTSKPFDNRQHIILGCSGVRRVSVLGGSGAQKTLHFGV